MATGRLPDPNSSPLTAKGDLYTYSTVPAKLAVGSNGDTLVADSSATTGLRWQETYAAGKNKIINGAMLIDQRNAGAAVTCNSGTAVYAVDRFEAEGVSADGVYTLQQDSSAPAGFDKSIKVTVTTADASIGSTQQYIMSQKIEGLNCADLSFGTSGAKTITLSFWVRSSLTGTFGGSIRNSAVNRSYPFSYSISVADTWEKKTITIAGDTTGTWLKTTGIGMRVTWSIGSGTDRLATAGAWAGANYSGATGQTNLIGTLNATWYITGVQLEIGSVATPFTMAGGTIAGELAACQRYYYRNNPGVTYKGLGTGMAYSTTAGIIMIPFPVEMRTRPTAIEQSGTATDYVLLNSSGSNVNCNGVPTFDATTSKWAGWFTVTVASGLTAGNATHCTTGNSTTGYLGWSAEL